MSGIGGRGSGRVAGALAGLALGLLAAAPARAATITITALDPAGSGFFDPTPVAPVGGNSGLTRGAQRMEALEYAASVWAGALSSAVDIEVEAIFAPSGCGGASATLVASSGPKTVHRDFPGAPLADTWYPQALANRLAGLDVAPASADIVMQFNRSLDEGCGDGPFYYGLDGAAPSSSLDFVTAALHELAHGLGMASLIEPFSGARFLGRNDVYSAALVERESGLQVAALDADAIAAAWKRNDALLFGGPVTADAAAGKASGLDAGGRVRMFTASGANVTSAASHFTDDFAPDELMEPFYEGPNHDVGLALALLEEIGWADPALPCGDGVVDPLEECDDGAVAYGDCCSALCTIEAAGTDCTADGLVCRDDVCDGSGSCLAGIAPAGTSCDDGDACTTGELCDGGGACTDGDAVDCDDGQVCTTEICDTVDGCLYTPTAEPCTGEFVVNTTRLGSQVSPAVAADADGDFVVIWRDFDLEGTRPSLLAAQRFSAEGTRVGNEFVVVGHEDREVGAPEACSAADGDAVVVWHGEGVDSEDGLDVFVSLLAGDGAAPTLPLRVNVTTAGDQGDPEVACAEDGSFVVVWTSVDPSSEDDQDGDEHGVFFQRFDADGTRLGEETQANATTAGRQWGPAVALADDGGFVVAWASGCSETDLSAGCEPGGAAQDGSYAGVYARRFDPAGMAEGGEIRLNQATDGQQGLPHLELESLPGGGFVAVWNGARDGAGGCGSESICLELYARLLDDDAQPVDDELRVNTHDADAQLAPAVAVAADASVVVLWESDGQEPGLVGDDPVTGKPIRSSRGVLGRRITPAGTAEGPEFLTNVEVQGVQNRASLAAQPDGGWIAAWRSGADEAEALVPIDECAASADGCRDGIVARRLLSAVPACGAEPLAACTDAGRSRLRVKAPGGGKDKLVWKWQIARAMAGELSPAAGLAGYALCLYDASAAPGASMVTVAPDADCGAKDCWKAKLARRVGKYKFKRKGAGALKIGLRSSSEDGAKILVKAKGAELAAPVIGDLLAPAVLQLVSSTGGCWQSTFQTLDTTPTTLSAR